MFGNKVYIQVEARFYPDGKLVPVYFWWEDGRRFNIDRIMDVRQTVSLKAGGHGTRYTCSVLGKTVYLFYEDNGRWFMDA